MGEARYLKSPREHLGVRVPDVRRTVRTAARDVRDRRDVLTLATALWSLWPRHVLFYAALAFVVAASRVVTGAHYLSDVIAGGFVAVLVTRAVAFGFVRFRLKLPLGSGAILEPLLRLP